MANNRRPHAERPVTDPLIELYDIEMPARFGASVQRWTPGPLMSFGSNLVNMNAWWATGGGGWITANDSPDQIGRASTYLGASAPLEDLGLFGRSGTTTNGNTFEMRNATTQIIAAPGQWFELQGWVNGINADLRLSLIFRDAGGTIVGGTFFGPTITGTGPSAIRSPNDLIFASYQAQAPTNSAFVQIGLRGLGRGVAGAQILVHRLMLARIEASSTVPLSYQKPSVITGNVSFGGVAYSPVPLGISGWEVASNGPIPRPRITVPNIAGFTRALMGLYGDLLGAKLSRKRVFLYALDGMDAPDSTDFYGPDVWYFDRVVMAAPEFVEFELCSPLDLQGKMLPNGQIIRDVCTHSYRRWNALTSSFVPGTCPYAGSGMWDASGAATGTSSPDDCGRRIADCDTRFPGQALPTKAFPGVAVSRR
jgi:lambda family phage minor tail protein L